MRPISGLVKYTHPLFHSPACVLCLPSQAGNKNKRKVRLPHFLFRGHAVLTPYCWCQCHENIRHDLHTQNILLRWLLIQTGHFLTKETQIQPLSCKTNKLSISFRIYINTVGDRSLTQYKTVHRFVQLLIPFTFILVRWNFSLNGLFYNTLKGPCFVAGSCAFTNATTLIK